MASEDSTTAARGKSLVALAGFVALCFAVAAVGGAVTATSVGTWYAGLAKPSFNPPNWLFGPVWSALYLMVAVTGWRVWRRRGHAGTRIALAAWGLQLALNLGWSFLFFGAQMIGAALVEIVLLLVAILVTAVLSWRIDRVAGWLLVPYAVWVGFATLLNAALWRLNG
jgi:tryptophan-rich sensory protein